MSFFKETSGFTLIELAIVLAILGVITGFSLPILSHFKAIERKQVTQKHQELILTALGAYAARHHQLPCPANEGGLARVSCNGPDHSHSYGLVPYRSLGIPESTAKDGFGHFLHYAVNPFLTEKDSYCTHQPSLNADESHFTLNDENGTSVIDEQEQTPLAVIILSEGEAYKRPVSPQEIDNMAPHLRFHVWPYAQNPEHPFRHLVSWASRDLLMTYYGNSSCAKVTLRPQNHSPQPDSLMNEPDPLFQ